MKLKDGCLMENSAKSYVRSLGFGYVINGLVTEPSVIELLEVFCEGEYGY